MSNNIKQQQSPYSLGEYLKQVFLKGQGAITQRPGPAHPSVRKFYSQHKGYDIGTPSGTPITPSFSGEVLGTTVDNTGYGQRIAIYNPAANKTYYLSHLSKAVIPQGSFQAGQPIAYSGGTPGAYGAGNTTGAHIDIQSFAGKNPFSQMLAGIKNAFTGSRRSVNLGDIAKQIQAKYGGRVMALSKDQSKIAAWAKGKNVTVQKVRL